MYVGINRFGDRAVVRSSSLYRRPEGDVGLFYGQAGQLVKALTDYPAAGRKAVYADLGYWKRKDGGRYDGYHKLVVNNRHPTAYFQMAPHDDVRARALGLQMAPWTRGENIVVVALGPKGARHEGTGRVLDWEKGAIVDIKRVTDRPIVFRPKPNWDRAGPLWDLGYSPPTELVDAQFPTAHAIVSYHSNANVEGLVAGVPSFTLHGAAGPLSWSDLKRIEAPFYPSDQQRWQWICDLAYTQWNIAEMTSGEAWAHMRREGLI
jgi:hypothetical protein